MTRRRLRIALVGLTAPFRGGIAHHTTLLCRALRERHEVRFFALSRQYPRILFPGITQLDRSARPLETDHEATLDSLNPASWLWTARKIQRQRPDLLLIAWWHPFFGPAFGTIAWLARRAGIPVCFLCHNASPHEASRADDLLGRFALSAGSALLAHSRADAELLGRWFPDKPIAQHPHPVYAEWVPAEPPTSDDAKSTLGLAGEKVVLFFGLVRAYKGLDVLLDAFARLGPSGDHHLLVVGEFYQDRRAYAPGLRILADRDQLTLVDRYVPNEDLPLYFSAADVVAAPYRSASQSGVVQIAFAFGKPVVATRVGGLPDLVLPGETGLLVPPADPAALADALRESLQPDGQARFSQGIAALRTRCSWSSLVDAIEALVPTGA